jgi:hypothetical protein
MEKVNKYGEKLVYLYMGIDRAKEGNDISAYFLYDPATDIHHEIDKEKYEKVLRNAYPIDLQ